MQRLFPSGTGPGGKYSASRSQIQTVISLQKGYYRFQRKDTGHFFQIGKLGQELGKKAEEIHSLRSESWRGTIA